MNGMNAQEDAARSYAARHGYAVGGVYDDPGVSGSVGLECRPGLLDAIAHLKRGDILLVSKRDRIGRLDPMAMAMIEAAVRRKGARIVSAAGEGTEDDEPSSILMRRMVDAFAQYERLIIQARTKAALQAKRKRGEKTGGAIPYGYQRGPDKPGPNGVPIKTLIECPEEQTTLATMRALRRQGMPMVAIARYLTANGVPRRAGGRWEHQYVNTLLKRSKVNA